MKWNAALLLKNRIFTHVCELHAWTGRPSTDLLCTFYHLTSCQKNECGPYIPTTFPSERNYWFLRLWSSHAIARVGKQLAIKMKALFFQTSNNLPIEHTSIKHQAERNLWMEMCVDQLYLIIIKLNSRGGHEWWTVTINTFTSVLKSFFYKLTNFLCYI